MVRISKLKLAALSFALLISFGMVATSARVSALSGGEFQAGRIIDDSVMYDGNAMSAQEIQAFLNAKVPVCDTNGTQMRGNVTRAAHGTANGYPPPYTCLKDFAENTPTKAADAYCANTYFGGVKTAAQIIYDVSRACNVSQKALIVLLQKEQSLITDDWPWSIQYRAATGYGCPDTAACDAEYYGFFNQVYNASRQLQRYVKQSSYFNYRGGETSYIQYNPNAGCGGSNVYLQNSATAALYNYTPYQPNTAALDNLYGSGDGCSAYGNRNFWRLFNDWFGSTVGNPYSWSLVSTNGYTDNTKTAPSNLLNLRIGQKAYVTFVAKNTGRVTWTNSGNNPVRVGTINQFERQSAFAAGSGWLSNSRPATMKESSVPPGSNATFEFWVTANVSGTFNERFGLLSEGLIWMNDTGLNFTISVVPDVYSWSWVSQNAYTDQDKTTGKNLMNMTVGEKAYISFTAKNTGNVTWTNTGSNPIRVGTTAPNERNSVLANGSNWLWGSRPATMKESSVPPGSNATFEFWVTANKVGAFNERFNLLAENRAWMNDVGLSYDLKVNPPTYSWSWVSQNAYTDQNKTTIKNLLSMNVGERAYLSFTAKNTGNVTWTNTGSNPIRVGTTAPNERLTTFTDGDWLWSTRPATMKESSVPPGENATFEFYVRATSPGAFNERFNLLAENRAWMNDVGLSYDLKVNPPTYSWSWVSQNAYTDQNKTTGKNLMNMTVGEKAYISFTAKNTGNATWTNSGPNPVRVGTTAPNERSTTLANSSGWLWSTRPATMKESSVPPGSNATFEFWVTANKVGAFNERFNLLAENRAWMNDVGLSYDLNIR